MSNWKFVDNDADTDDALFVEKYLEGIIIAPEYDDEEVKIIIGKYDKDHSAKYKYFIEATLAPYGDLIFSDDFKDIKELKSALRKLQAQVDEDIEYPSEEDIEKLTFEEEIEDSAKDDSYKIASMLLKELAWNKGYTNIYEFIDKEPNLYEKYKDELEAIVEENNEDWESISKALKQMTGIETSAEEKDKFAWVVKSDYINPEITTSHQDMVPCLIGRNLEKPEQEIRIYIVPDILSEDEKSEAKTDFVLEIANGIDDTEILTAFDNFSDILESLDEWHENQNSEHNLVENYVHCPKKVLKEFFKRNEVFRNYYSMDI